MKFMKRCKVWKLKDAETESTDRECRQELQCVGKPRDACVERLIADRSLSVCAVN